MSFIYQNNTAGTCAIIMMYYIASAKGKSLIFSGTPNLTA
jgi:hypothetical protein